MNPYDEIAEHHEGLERLFRRLGKPLDADYHAGMARIYRARAGAA